MSDQGQITFTDVGFSFGDKMILEHFSESIQTGEHVAIMGESGAGKSTLLNSIVGLSIPSMGIISVHGIQVSSGNIQKIRETVSWIPQNLQLPYATVMEMLEAPYGYAVHKGKDLNMSYCFQLMERLGLNKSILEKSLKSLSGGERQRLFIISSLMLGRSVLLMDEPTSALDSENVDRLSSLLKELSETTILTVTHDRKFADSMDRIIKLEKTGYGND